MFPFPSRIENGRKVDNIENHTYSLEAEKTTTKILTFFSLGLTSVLIFWFISNPTRFFSEILGINQVAFQSVVPWILTIFIATGYIIYTAKAVPFVRKHLFTFSALKWIGVWAALVSSTVEEILFRQVLMDWLMALNYSVPLQVIISAIAFGVAHGAWIMLRGDFRIALPVILSTTILGFFLAVLYLIADRNVLLPIVAHIIINVVIEPWLILAAVTGAWKDQK